MIRITTESGSVYELADDRKTVRRTRGPLATFRDYDCSDHGVHSILNGPTVGEAFVYRHGLRIRVSTLVTSVEEVP